MRKRLKNLNCGVAALRMLPDGGSDDGAMRIATCDNEEVRERQSKLHRLSTGDNGDLLQKKLTKGAGLLSRALLTVRQQDMPSVAHKVSRHKVVG